MSSLNRGVDNKETIDMNRDAHNTLVGLKEVESEQVQTVFAL